MRRAPLALLFPYHVRVCDACAQLVTGQREAMIEDVLRRTGWPSVPSSDGATVRFAFFDTEGLVGGVRLRHGLAGHRNPPNFVDEGDGLFTLEFEAGDAVRVEYQFELQGPGGRSSLIHDPFNPFVTDDPFGGKSVVMREGHADSIWLAEPPSAFIGEFIEHPIELAGPGEITGVRQMAIWQAPGIEVGDDVPLLLFLDGTDYVRYGHLRRILENLVGWGQLAACRAVFIAPLKRDEEYSANPAMLPWFETLFALLREFKILPPDSGKRIGVGASLGALCLLNAGTLRPDLFGGLALQSGSFFQPKTDAMESAFSRYHRIVETVADIYERRFWSGGPRIAATCGTAGENIRNNDRMMDALHEHGVNIVSYQRVRDAHNWTAWRNCIGEALTALLPGPRGFPSL